MVFFFLDEIGIAEVFKLTRLIPRVVPDKPTQMHTGQIQGCFEHKMQGPNSRLVLINKLPGTSMVGPIICMFCLLQVPNGWESYSLSFVQLFHPCVLLLACARGPFSCTQMVFSSVYAGSYSCVGQASQGPNHLDFLHPCWVMPIGYFGFEKYPCVNFDLQRK